jgi:hypothetical protein
MSNRMCGSDTHCNTLIDLQLDLVHARPSGYGCRPEKILRSYLPKAIEAVEWLPCAIPGTGLDHIVTRTSNAEWNLSEGANTRTHDD